MKCRHCKTKLHLQFLDLGNAPLSNNYLTHDKLNLPELWFPLRILVCEKCWLVQTHDYASREDLFAKDYAYFSSISSTWLEHAKHYVDQMIERFALNMSSQVVEVAANDGYLLQYVQNAGIPCYGIEPTSSTANAARAKGIEIIECFFGIELADELVRADKKADLIVANNVLAHVPDINDFVSGISRLLKPNGIATFEFPHLMRMIQENQFDTVYHEHYSYLSLTAVQCIFNENGLTIFDVEEIPTHGGSLRVFTQRADNEIYSKNDSVSNLLKSEQDVGVGTSDFYRNFQLKAEKIKDDLLYFLIDAKRRGLKVAAYGAAAKGNTLLNFAGIRSDLISFVVDKNPAKQSKYLPGSKIPIVDESCLMTEKPNLVLILPWNLQNEVMAQLTYIENWGGQFFSAIPELKMIRAGNK